VTERQNEEEAAAEIYLERLRLRRRLDLVATPLPSDVFLLSDGSQMAWSDIRNRRPSVPLGWWMNLDENRPLALAHSWLQTRGFIRGGEPTLLQVYLVRTGEHIYPQDFVCEVLPDDYSLRQIAVHIDAHLLTTGDPQPSPSVVGKA